jgi:tetratricopeptide (TPR) repeat protein
LVQYPSLVAERDAHWVLARTYAEKAKSQYEELTDRTNIGRLLNNLGGLEFLLGKPEQAITRLHEAFGVVLEHGNDDAIATVVSSLAQVHLKTGDPVKAEEHARHALARLGTRRTSWTEIGNARLVLGRALLDQDRLDEAGWLSPRQRRRAVPTVVRFSSSRCLGRPGRPRPATW